MSGGKITIGDVLDKMGLEQDELYVTRTPNGELKFYVEDPIEIPEREVFNANE